MENAPQPFPGLNKEAVDFLGQIGIKTRDNLEHFPLHTLEEKLEVAGFTVHPLLQEIYDFCHDSSIVLDLTDYNKEF